MNIASILKGFDEEFGTEVHALDATSTESVKSFLQEKLEALLGEIKEEIDILAFESEEADKVRLYVDWDKAAAIIESKK